MKTRLLLTLSLALTLQAYAGSATWNLNPASNDWSSATNWTPATVPNGSADVATFSTSDTTTISLSSAIEVSGLVFEPGASLFTFAVGTNAKTDVDITGAGITNSPGITQTFIAQRNASGGQGVITFRGSANAGSGTVFIVQGGVENNFNFAATQFADQASAGNGIFHCEGGINHGVGGSVSFFDDATAAQGIFTVEGGASARSGGGDIYFGDSSTAGDASITVNGTNFSGALPGLVQFAAVTSATAGNASLVANAGSVAGGEIRFAGPTTSGGTARIELVGNGTLNVSGSLHPAITIGSLTGDGVVLLGSNPLTIGSNSLSTLFSGVIEGTGTITKIGSGTLTLGGASTYTGATTVSAGVLLVANQTGSATGSGLVSVNSGTLGGGGIISGGVEIGGGATLAPASGSSNQVTLTLQQSLNLTAGAKYLMASKRGRASRAQTWSSPTASPLATPRSP